MITLRMVVLLAEIVDERERIQGRSSQRVNLWLNFFNVSRLKGLQTQRCWVIRRINLRLNKGVWEAYYFECQLKVDIVEKTVLNENGTWANTNLTRVDEGRSDCKGKRVSRRMTWGKPGAAPEKTRGAMASMRLKVSTLTNIHRSIFFLAWKILKWIHFFVSAHEINVSIEQKSLEINPNLYGNFIHNNGGIVSQGEKMGFYW